MKFLAIITLIILFGLISASQVQEEDVEIAVTRASSDPCSIYTGCTACMSLTSSCFFDTVSQTCRSAGLYSLDICNSSANNVIWSLSLLFITMIITLLFV